MDLNNVDNELNIKIFEVLKLILKEENTSISFEVPVDNLEEIIIVSNKEHNFKLIKLREKEIINELNYNYYKLLSKKIKMEYTNLTDINLINKIKNIKILKILKPFLGKIVNQKNIINNKYVINYNNIVLNLEKSVYDKYLFYIKNVYKLQQLNTLNKKLNIEQKFNIVFEEETVKNDLYDSFYKYFKDIIKPPEN